ncbi:EAL domain-containing protein [Massilia endophytica]|uniref:EAL domain-containing protein n=1 Tax=Massilia endophytica TaxID=2899220 RepID=UPI001E5D7156|nr:EAL domain-containing protein [Massilia endophytica]UGQ48994.1 EAL domain-containing protein [Massilia endophytica]
MAYPVLQQYLARLGTAENANSSLWLDSQGRARGRFFNCSMTSVFQTVRELDSGRPVGAEGLARSAAPADEGLSLWRLLDHAASDDESVELDRLCRMLHAINFFRQEASAGLDLHLNVHARLLGAVSSNHGYAFRRILDALGLPLEHVVLQLPRATPQQSWLLNYVADNYRRNGFRFGVAVSGAREGLALLDRVRPDVLRVDTRKLDDAQAVPELLLRSAELGARTLFRRIEDSAALLALSSAAQAARVWPLVQGELLDAPAARLPAHEEAAAA